MNKTIRILLSLPKTVLLNFKALPFIQAVKLPLFVSYDTDLSIKGRIEIAPDAKVRTAMVRFGFLCALACDTNSRTRLHVQKDGVLRFMGDAHLGHGTRMIVREGAEMILGDNFAVSSNSTIQCYSKVVFGSDVQFAWECLVMDSDTHNILDEDGKVINHPSPVYVGNRVWIGARSTILKGSSIPDDTVIGACSLVVAGRELKDHSVIAGQPARSIRTIGGWSL